MARSYTCFLYVISPFSFSVSSTPSKRYSSSRMESRSSSSFCFSRFFRYSCRDTSRSVGSIAERSSSVSYRRFMASSRSFLDMPASPVFLVLLSSRARSRSSNSSRSSWSASRCASLSRSASCAASSSSPSSLRPPRSCRARARLRACNASSSSSELSAAFCFLSCFFRFLSSFAAALALAASCAVSSSSSSESIAYCWFLRTYAVF
mmetsp:Transcript_26724/g.58201  ORF Transcript_26724/g.58201 Transcript_26724/m.58201 type:complete len:207 (+) Transcript_26724:518-1138(+)